MVTAARTACYLASKASDAYCRERVTLTYWCLWTASFLDTPTNQHFPFLLFSFHPTYNHHFIIPSSTFFLFIPHPHHSLPSSPLSSSSSTPLSLFTFQSVRLMALTTHQGWPVISSKSDWESDRQPRNLCGSPESCLRSLHFQPLFYLLSLFFFLFSFFYLLSVFSSSLSSRKLPFM